MTLLKNDQTSYDQTKVVVIIATYNGSNYIVNCIQSILEGYIIPQIIMIDNNSSDATIELVRKTFQEIKIIKLSQNQGFGFANNIGIKYALEELKADYFFLLNQDTVVERNTIQNLLKVAKKNPEYGIISPMHFNNQNSLDANFENYIKPYFKSVSNSSDERVRKITLINAAAWLVTRSCIEEVGGFDTSMFFHYGEDTNYCQRVSYHGYGIGFVTNSNIIHFRSNKLENIDSIRALDMILLRKRTEITDIAQPDTVANSLLKKYLISIFSIFIKSVFTLDFGKTKYLFNEYKKGNIFIKQKMIYSRNVNKCKGLNWLK